MNFVKIVTTPFFQLLKEWSLLKLFNFFFFFYSMTEQKSKSPPNDISPEQQKFHENMLKQLEQQKLIQESIKRLEEDALKG